MTNGSFHPDGRNGTPNAVTGNDGTLSPADYANWPKPGEQRSGPAPGTAPGEAGIDRGAALPRNGTPSSGDLPLPLPPAPAPGAEPGRSAPGTPVEGAQGADGSGTLPYPAKAPAWLKIGGKGAQGRPLTWLTGRSRADRKAVKGPECPTIDDRRVLAAARGQWRKGRSGPCGAGAVAFVTLAVRAGLPPRVFSSAALAQAAATVRNEQGRYEAATRWLRALLGDHVTVGAVIKVLVAKHGKAKRPKAVA